MGSFILKYICIFSTRSSNSQNSIDHLVELFSPIFFYMAW